MALTREKSIEFIRKLRKQAESELILGNEGASELFTEKANDLISKYELSEDELIIIESNSYQIINEIGKTIVPNPFLRQNAKTNLHQEWFSNLAEEVGINYKCKTAPRVNEGSVSFYGYDLDREMAIFMFLRLADVAERLSKKELPIAKKNVGKPTMKDFATKEEITFPKIWNGSERFLNSFHFGFRTSLKELHEKQQNGVIPQEVEEYFAKDDPYRNDNSTAIHISEYDFIPEYVRIGAKAGRIAFKKSTSSTAIVSSKAKDKINSIIRGEDTVVLAIDESSSMSGSKIEQAKEGAIEFARKSIEKGYKVAIIGFGDSARVISKPEGNIEVLENLVRNLTASGCTRMSDAFRVSIPFFTSRKSKRTICIVTDGKPYSWYGEQVEIAETLNAANDAKRLGIEIMALGCDGADEEFLQKLSSREGLGQLVSKEQLLLGIGRMAEELK
jgi:uncharacterized protein YegL